MIWLHLFVYFLSCDGKRGKNPQKKHSFFFPKSQRKFKGGGSGGSSSTGDSNVSTESSLVDAIAFTPRELFIGVGMLIAAFWVISFHYFLLILFKIYVISRNISRIPKKTKMPCDFGHINDPIKRQQEIRYKKLDPHNN